MDSRIEATIETIQKRMSGNLDVHVLARETNLSISHLRHTFKAETGLTLNQFIKLTRMQEAKRLLTSTFLTCKQVMNSVGINSESHFSREFRKTHGIPPSKLRLGRNRFGIGEKRDS
jgi:AraC-like DNA-binding protein